MKDIPRDRLADATAVLLLAPSGEPSLGPSGDGGEDGDETCRRLLSLGPPAATNLLRITYSGRPGSVVEEWASRPEAHPAKARVVAVGAAAARVRGATDGGVPGVETVREPADVTGLAITAGEVLSGWEGDGNRTVVCFDSVTHLLDHVSFETAFRFLHVFSRRVGVLGATGHYHLDPAAHDDRVVQGFKGLFDAVVEVSPDREVTVRPR